VQCKISKVIMVIFIKTVVVFMTIFRFGSQNIKAQILILWSSQLFIVFFYSK